jgi:hypothetical protein
MKTKETLSNTATAKAAYAVIGTHAVELTAKKFWLPIILGASLFYMSHSAHAQEQQGTGGQTLQSADTSVQSRSGGPPPTQKQGAGRGTKPHPEYSGTQSNQGSVQRYRNLVQGDEPGGSQSMSQGATSGQVMKQGMPSGQNTNPDDTSSQSTNPGDTSGQSTNPGATPGIQPPPRDTTLDTEKMNSGSAPNTENINKDTVGPGGDNMMRDAIPGGSGMNRE